MKMQSNNTHNNVKMIVNLGTNPTVKALSDGRKIAKFSVASLARLDDTGKSKVKWFTVISWGSLAVYAETKLRKGKRVLLTGNLVTRTWTDKRGISRHRQEILATDIIPLHNGRTPVASIAA